MDINILKKNYNKVLDREKKAEKFLDIATEDEYKRWESAFLKIIVELSQMMKDYKRLTGTEMTSDEVLNGFK